MIRKGKARLAKGGIGGFDLRANFQLLRASRYPSTTICFHGHDVNKATRQEREVDANGQIPGPRS
jgi:hypothetical protein